MALLDVDGLRTAFGDVAAVDGISFSVDAGRTLTLRRAALPRRGAAARRRRRRSRIEVLVRAA
jgi:hypothetical protein